MALGRDDDADMLFIYKLSTARVSCPAPYSQQAIPDDYVSARCIMITGNQSYTADSRKKSGQSR
jgi:hypothetical protein